MQSTVQSVYYSEKILLKEPHFHDCHQIILIVKGNVEFCVRENILRAGSGDIVIFSRYENHSVSVCTDEYARYVLQIDPAAANGESPVYSLLTDRPAGFCNVISTLSHTEEIVKIFEKLLSEHGSEKRLTDEMEQLLVNQLLITVFRCTDLQTDCLRDHVVLDLKRLFENNFGEHYTLEYLARKHCISVSSLSHRFRTVTGVSVMEYLQTCRIAHAKHMLAEGKHSIGKIVEICGFSDNSNFSRVFKKRNGISPSVFRKKYQAE